MLQISSIQELAIVGQSNGANVPQYVETSRWTVAHLCWAVWV
jgi:hypothetical protein